MGLNQLEQDIEFRLDKLNLKSIISPEEAQGHLNETIMSEMIKCRNLDFFYDVVFVLDGDEKIRVNSAVLRARSDYFNAMFSSRHNFRESYYTHSIQDDSQSEVSSLKRVVRIFGVEKKYFAAIV